MTHRKGLNSRSILKPDEVNLLRCRIARCAQDIYAYYEKHPPENGGGICDEIASGIVDIVYNSFDDADAQVGGWPGDDHAPVIAVIRGVPYHIDIPPDVYEVGGGYNWRVLEGVIISPSYVVIRRLPLETLKHITIGGY
jgi:hypothetical protein